AHPCVLTGNTLILEANHEDFHVRETESVPARDDNLPIDEKTVETLFERHNARKSLGWWQVMRGDEIHPQ
ncbi:MAG: hypothetical protein LBQ96_02545, partial [Fusobacteriaceae bacterium]|nr:hypothetical protein [Fusobacteriaceae bacterium]